MGQPEPSASSFSFVLGAWRRGQRDVEDAGGLPLATVHADGRCAFSLLSPDGSPLGRAARPRSWRPDTWTLTAPDGTPLASVSPAGWRRPSEVTLAHGAVLQQRDRRRPSGAGWCDTAGREVLAVEVRRGQGWRRPATLLVRRDANLLGVAEAVAVTHLWALARDAATQAAVAGIAATVAASTAVS